MKYIRREKQLKFVLKCYLMGEITIFIVGPPILIIKPYTEVM